jgi:hypothetical protein
MWICGQSDNEACFLRVLQFPCQFTLHRLLHTHHYLSSRAGTTGQTVADVPCGHSLTPPQDIRIRVRIRLNRLIVCPIPPLLHPVFLLYIPISLHHSTILQLPYAYHFAKTWFTLDEYNFMAVQTLLIIHLLQVLLLHLVSVPWLMASLLHKFAITRITCNMF